MSERDRQRFTDWREKKRKHPHVAPFGRECATCGCWLDTEDEIARPVLRQITDFGEFNLTYVMYKCWNCKELSINEKKTIYD